MPTASITEESVKGTLASDSENQTPRYKPTKDQKKRIEFVYTERADMLEVLNDKYPQFNDRTLKEFIDDSEKRLNAYVQDRASQGKED
jgi:hypothetical protein